MGYLVLQEQEELVYRVVDGQQRFTTFSLIILAAIKQLQVLKDTERATELRNNFIGSKNLTTLDIENKLTLNNNNNFYYNQAVEEQAIPTRNVTKTVKLMRKALDFFYKKFTDFYEGAKIGRFVQNVSNRMLFTTIYISDELNAYKVFETLNARGVKLLSADLLKNYLFSKIDRGEDIPRESINRLDDKWSHIGAGIAGQTYTDYLLIEWNSCHKRVRQNQLFRVIKDEITNTTEAQNYLTKLVAQ